MAVYGYARVSSRGQDAYGEGLDIQVDQLRQAGVPENNIVTEVASAGQGKDRPKLDGLIKTLAPGDKLVVPKLDRVARSVEDGTRIIRELTEKGVIVNVLNLTEFNPNTATGKLIIEGFFMFAEFERNMIRERTEAGYRRGIKEGRFKPGRPKRPKRQQQHCYELYQQGKSYREIEEMTGIPHSTAMRYCKAIQAERNGNND